MTDSFRPDQVGAFPGEAKAAELAPDSTQEPLPSDLQATSLHTEEGQRQTQSATGKIQTPSDSARLGVFLVSLGSLQSAVSCFDLLGF